MAKCSALSAEGLTARHWAGGYGYPPPTVTGAAQRDVALLESCIGVGEVAVSDHRSSMPSAGELARLARRALGLWVRTYAYVVYHAAVSTTTMQLFAALARLQREMHGRHTER